MPYVADLHIHSPYSRATSAELTLDTLAYWAQRKGVHLVGTGDCVHPAWLDRIESALEPADDGFLRPRAGHAADVPELPAACRGEVRFVPTVEISNIYRRLDKVRKVHNLIVLPSVESARKLQARLEAIGNIASDGRPILGLDSRDLLEMVLEVDPRALLIPAHIWTPWFSALGSKSGFESIEQCYADLCEHITAVETGLSSDPPMNWRVSSLDRYALVSHSDAHSPSKLAREATLFETDFDFEAFHRALTEPAHGGLAGTIEFFPEEGKYHYDGHRGCGVRLTPTETAAHDGRCPVCGKPVTVGVMARVEALADRRAGTRPPRARDYRSYVPLPEVVGQVLQRGAGTKVVRAVCDALLARLGNELHILGEAPLEQIRRASDPLIAEAIRRMRAGEVEALAGYDGEFGTIQVVPDDVRERLGAQLSLFVRQTKQPKPGKRAAGVPAGPVEEAPPAGNGPPRLNAAQREAVDHDGARVAIIAGPGTGKTHTLAHRIARLAGDIPDNRYILAVTFTNRAADEMRERIAALAPHAVERTRIGTFHQICLWWLRQFDQRTGLPSGFGVASEAEIETAARRAWPERTASQRAANLAAASAWKAGTRFTGEPDEAREYTAALRELGLVDFDDLIREAVRMLRDDPGVRERVRSALGAVCVDEFQDIDDMQHELLTLVVGSDLPLTVIGDPDQSIYGFRGSSSYDSNASPSASPVHTEFI